MQREIGSNFDLNPEIVFNKKFDLKLSQYGIQGSDEVFLSTGRAAEGIVLDTIQSKHPEIRKVALVPPYTCETVISPFVKRGYEIFTYPIEIGLGVDLEKFRNILDACRAQVVLVHRYFGFDTLKGFERIIEEFKSQGVVFIEDQTQCFYSAFDKLPVDYIIGSLRKWAALPDGGFAVCMEGIFDKKPVDYDRELEKKKMDAAYLKYEYLHGNKNEKQEFLKKFKLAEEILESEKKYFRISPSGIEVQCNLDIEELKNKRRNNYFRLYEGIRNYGNYKILTPQLGEYDVPLYLAILAKNRNEIQAKLREKKIYAPIVWPKSKCMPAICQEAQEIFDTVLCFPIDQRYDEDDMERIIQALGSGGGYVSG